MQLSYKAYAFIETNTHSKLILVFQAA